MRKLSLSFIIYHLSFSEASIIYHLSFSEAFIIYHLSFIIYIVVSAYQDVGLLKPVVAVEITVADGFGYVMALHLGCSLQVGDGA